MAKSTPHGNVIFTADTPAFHAPTKMFEYNSTTSTITDITPTLPAGLQSQLNQEACFVDRMLVLPSGQVLFSDAFNQVWLLSEPRNQCQLAAEDFRRHSRRPGSGQFTLTGQQLNGMDEGAAYGDDAEMSTNYPIVRLVSTATGSVYYTTTSNWTTLGVQTGTTMGTTTFTLPLSVTPGNYVMTVIANGVPSNPATINITASELDPPGDGSSSSSLGQPSTGGDSGSPTSPDLVDNPGADRGSDSQANNSLLVSHLTSTNTLANNLTNSGSSQTAANTADTSTSSAPVSGSGQTSGSSVAGSGSPLSGLGGSGSVAGTNGPLAGDQQVDDFWATLP